MVGKERFIKQHLNLKGDSVGVSAAYDVKAGDEVKMKIAISYTSIAKCKEKSDWQNALHGILIK